MNFIEKTRTYTFVNDVLKNIKKYYKPDYVRFSNYKLLIIFSFSELKRNWDSKIWIITFEDTYLNPDFSSLGDTWSWTQVS